MEPEFLDVNGRPYRIIRLLGKGKGGYSYLAGAADAERRRPEPPAGPAGDAGGKTECVPGDGLCVLKQIHHEPCSYYRFGDKLAAELHDYDRLRRAGVPMPALLDADRRQERILKEYIPGETVYQLILRDALPPVCIEQLRQLCRGLYAAGLNIDYFPTNFIPWNGRLYYVDYECNAYEEQWDFEHWGITYWSKTPEFLQYAAGHP